MNPFVGWITVLGILGGGVAWLTDIQGLARANARELKVVRDYRIIVRNIDKRLSRIEGALGVGGE